MRSVRQTALMSLVCIVLGVTADAAEHVSGDREQTNCHCEDHAAEAHCECKDPNCHGVCLDPGRPKKPKLTKPGDRDRGDCPPLRYRMDDCERSGKAQCVHRFAKCSVDGKYSAWFVGGGAAFFRGRGRTEAEGTWGLDYDGLFGKANNWLKYTRGRNQGGEGAYETDGEPKILSKAKSLVGHH